MAYFWRDNPEPSRPSTASSQQGNLYYQEPSQETDVPRRLSKKRVDRSSFEGHAGQPVKAHEFSARFEREGFHKRGSESPPTTQMHGGAVHRPVEVEQKKMLAHGVSRYGGVPMGVGGDDLIQTDASRLRKPYFDHHKQKMVYPGEEIGYDGNIGYGKRHGYERDSHAASTHMPLGVGFVKVDPRERPRGKKSKSPQRDDSPRGSDYMSETGLPAYIGHGKAKVSRAPDNYLGTGFEYAGEELRRGKLSVDSRADDMLGQDLSPKSAAEKEYGRKKIQAATSIRGAIYPDAAEADGNELLGAARLMGSSSSRATRPHVSDSHMSDMTSHPPQSTLHGMQHFDERSHVGGIIEGTDVESDKKPVGRIHVLQRDHVRDEVFAEYNPVTGSDSTDPARTVFTEQEMKERILVVVEQQHQLKLYDEKHWTNALVQKAGGKWCISGVDKGGKTISREGATAEIIAEAMKGLGLQELRVFGMRPRRSGSPVSELARRSHNTWNSSCIDRTFDENSGAGPHRYILERPSVNDGTRFGVRNKYEIDEYGLTDGRAGRRHFDPVSSFQESGMTIREDAPTTTPETPHRPEAAGHQPPVFFGGRWTSFHPTISVGDEGVRRKFIKAPHHYMKPDWWWEDRDRRVSTGPNPKNYENQEPTPRAKK
ncbi:unnamed protein product [Amoebophrya sp. A25]|nr:unnamed protein product [Amoebophrya sp. A25]|eukprot:GSA25T00016235001.1